MIKIKNYEELQKDIEICSDLVKREELFYKEEGRNYNGSLRKKHVVLRVKIAFAEYMLKNSSDADFTLKELIQFHHFLGESYELLRDLIFSLKEDPFFIEGDFVFLKKITEGDDEEEEGEIDSTQEYDNVDNKQYKPYSDVFSNKALGFFSLISEKLEKHLHDEEKWWCNDAVKNLFVPVTSHPALTSGDSRLQKKPEEKPREIFKFQFKNENMLVEKVYSNQAYDPTAISSLKDDELTSPFIEKVILPLRYTLSNEFHKGVCQIFFSLGNHALEYQFDIMEELDKFLTEFLNKKTDKNTGKPLNIEPCHCCDFFEMKEKLKEKFYKALDNFVYNTMYDLTSVLKKEIIMKQFPSVVEISNTIRKEVFPCFIKERYRKLTSIELFRTIFSKFFNLNPVVFDIELKETDLETDNGKVMLLIKILDPYNEIIYQHEKEMWPEKLEDIEYQNELLEFFREIISQEENSFYINGINVGMHPDLVSKYASSTNFFHKVAQIVADTSKNQKLRYSIDKVLEEGLKNEKEGKYVNAKRKFEEGVAKANDSDCYYCLAHLYMNKHLGGIDNNDIINLLKNSIEFYNKDYSKFHCFHKRYDLIEMYMRNKTLLCYDYALENMELLKKDAEKYTDNADGYSSIEEKKRTIDEKIRSIEEKIKQESINCLQEGEKYEKRRNYTEAEECFEKGIALKNSDCHFWLALLHMNNHLEGKNNNDIIKLLEESVELHDVNYSEVSTFYKRYNLILTYMEDKTLYGNALKHMSLLEEDIEKFEGSDKEEIKKSYDDIKKQLDEKIQISSSSSLFNADKKASSSKFYFSKNTRRNI